MALIELNQVSVAFPVYSAGSRSLKNAVISATTGYLTLRMYVRH